MKSLTIALAVTLLAGLAPIAFAAEGTCNETADTSFIEHPLEEGTYLYLDAREPNKLGEWTEDNGIAGLQTEMCVRSGIIRYVEDLHAAILP